MRPLALTTGLTLLLLGACAPASKKDARPAPPAPPPPVPPVVETPIDDALRRKASSVVETAVRSTDVFVRANAVEAAQAANDATTIQRMMNDPAPVVRFAATMAAGQLRLKTTNAKLIELAGDPSPSVRLGARFALHRLGDKRRSHDLEIYAADPADAGLRANTAMAIGLLGEPSGLKVLRGMRDDDAPTVRIAAMEAAWRLGDVSSRDKLVAGTVSADPGERIVSLLALAGPRDERLRPEIRSSLTAEYPEVSLAAARAMGMLGSDEGYGVALAGAKSTDARQRGLAALAFGEIGRRDAQPVLAKLLDDPTEPVRVAAAAAVLKLK